ncbi:MAG TPA: hypothetical protein VGC06_19360, partial [Actinomycetes bacterium]
FAWALDWPGWCRSGRTEEQALEALAGYLPRYQAVARQARIALPAAAAERLTVVERVEGSGATDFGVPHEITAADREKLDADEARRRARLVSAAWRVFDQVVAGAPAELRKGPRGGGRDRDKMVRHVLEAEAAYARALGIKLPAPELGDHQAIEGLRKRILAVLREPSGGEPLAPKGWPLRYAARRIAWHVLDHAWEMQDRSEPRG